MVLYESPVLSHVIHASSGCMLTEKKMSKTALTKALLLWQGTEVASSPLLQVW
jgi:hypothetical protein